MKHKCIGLVVCAGALAAGLLATAFEDGDTGRVHQHLETPGYTPCTDHADTEFCSHLPLLFVETGGVEIPGLVLSKDGTPLEQDAEEENDYKTTTLAADGSTTIACDVRVVDGAAANNHITDDPTIETAARIRIRGNTSRLYDKKGYLLRLTTDDGLKNRDEPLMGMDAHHEWALHGPYLDKSLIRNYMWYNIAGEIMDYAPNVRFCEIFIDGQYQGLYVLTETITNGEDSRLNLTQPRDDYTPSSYVIRQDRGGVNPLKYIETFSEYALRNLHQIDIVYPGMGGLTDARIRYIQQDFSDFEKSLYSYDYDTGQYAWWEQADLQSFVDYFILNEFTCNYDVGAFSTYMYKDVAGKYRMCIWDFNSACDNYRLSQTEPQGFRMQQILWYWMLSKDEHFVEAVIDRYRQLRQNWLSDDYLEQYVDDVAAWLGPAAERNFSVWGYTFAEWKPLLPEERNPADHAQALAQLKDFCVTRGAWMDENIDILQQYSHPSKVKKYNH